MSQLPVKFIESLESQLGSAEALELMRALDGEPTVSVRFNPYKLSEKPAGRQVPWSRYGYILEQRPVFTLDPMFHGGVYYVQEASSMFVEHIYRSTVVDNDKARILDVCAAPGGKTTLLSTLAGLEGAVVSNEVVRSRAIILADNVRKWGLGNVVVTNNDPSHFEGFADYFDFMLVDAPCSGEGMFRKSVEARREWSVDNVKLCAQRQRRILSEVWDSLKPGGVLVYSTCTFNRTENEDNIEWLTSEYDCEGVAVDVDSQWGIAAGEIAVEGAEPVRTFRFYPGKVEGEGFFAAVLRKGDRKLRTKTPKPHRNLLLPAPKPQLKELSSWVAQPDFMQFASVGDNFYGYYSEAYPVVKHVADTLSVVHSGVQMGQLFKGILKPDHSLAMFHDLNIEKTPQAWLTQQQALDYLRKKELPWELFSAEGMNLVTYEGLPLGWAKKIGNRINNLYPKELRILKQED